MTFNEKLADVAMDQESSEKASEATRPEVKSGNNAASSVNILTAFATNLAASDEAGQPATSALSGLINEQRQIKDIVTFD